MIPNIPPWFPSKTTDGTEPRSYRAWKWMLQNITQKSHSSNLLTKIDDVDWDLLIILDACRYDIIKEITTNVAVNRAISPVTVTQQFVKEVNNSNLFTDTTYYSANPATHQLDQQGLQHVPIYENAWNNRLSTVKPEDVYSEAKKSVRNDKRVVAHTLQPHYPHICSIDGDIYPVPGGIHPKSIGASMDETPAQNIPFAFFNGETNRHLAAQSYRACAIFAWKAAIKQAFELSNEGYTVVITADHGELLGEWGLAGHPWEVRVRQLVEVPWAVITENTNGPKQAEGVDEKLEALGYL